MHVIKNDFAGTPYAELASRPIHMVTTPPGPKARRAISSAKPFLSPSLIHCYPLYVERAAGCMVEDVDGNVYLDCEAGIATTSTGHCHPHVAAAMKAQVDRLIHICGTDFHYPGYGALCEKLGELAPAGGDWQAFLSNSGTEGVEAAIKLARYATGRPQLISFRHAFHGRSTGSLTLTASKPKYKKGFGPLLPGVSHAEFGNLESITKDLFEYTVPPSEVAAIFVEPVQGEGGYIVPDKKFLVGLREICDKHGILLVFDEVQSGMGRTGKMFAAEHFGVTPDIFVLAKGLASGMPLGAMMAKRSIMKWPPGTHGSTCGGNPVAIAAALATIELLENGLLDNAQVVGDHLRSKLATSLMGKDKGVIDVRGLGMMIGVEFETPEQSADVANLCFQRGLLVLECGKKAIRFAPPLILTKEQADVAATVFSQACADVRKGVKPQPPIEAEGHEEGI
jgi:4-aminobutyrate aminotransferase